MGFSKECNDSSKPCSEEMKVLNHQGICPEGWHIPSKTDWDELELFLDKEQAGKKMKLNNTLSHQWNQDSYNDGNSSGFSAIAIGMHMYKGQFLDASWKAYFWETTEDEQDKSKAYIRSLSSSKNVLAYSITDKAHAFSVRCLKN